MTAPTGETGTYRSWTEWAETSISELHGLHSELDTWCTQIESGGGDQSHVDAIRRWQAEIEDVAAAGRRMVDGVDATQRRVGEAVAAAGGSANTPHKEYADEARPRTALPGSSGGAVAAGPAPSAQQPALTREQQAANLPDEVKARLDGLTDRQAERLDVTSDEHQYVWGFRQDRPDEEHAERLADINADRPVWHERLAAAGHDMAWDLEDQGVGSSPVWYGKCRNCGAGISVGYLSTSAGRGSFRIARDVPCRGPGTAWQDEMELDLARQRLSGAVAQFGQAVKDAYDRAWLESQGAGD